MTVRTGVLYGIGVGPGDPDLITLKALEILRRVSKIFAAFSTKNDYSLAQGIVKSHSPGVSVERMDFPMTRDENALHSAWEKNARRVLEILETTQDAAFVTLGDPSTYSTFSHLLRTLKRLSPNVKVVTVPGITAFQASAARCNLPLVEGEESFHLISGAKGGAILRRIINDAENVVMLKVYRYFDDIYETLTELNLLDRSVCISRCGLDGEAVVEEVRSLKGKKMPYLSLIIIKKKGTAL